MRLLQLSPTSGTHCGLAVFGESLSRQLGKLGVEVETVPSLTRTRRAAPADVVLVQYHEDILTSDQVRRIAAVAGRPIVLLAHSPVEDAVLQWADGVMAMAAGMVAGTEKPILLFPHPAWIPDALLDRTVLRARLGLPPEAKIVGTSGFLRFERQLVEILSAVLPTAVALGWRIQLLTSPWRVDSPGLLEELATLSEQYPGHLWHVHQYLGGEELNRRLQACDLLWCWTGAPSSPYASGVASDLYASGSRIVAADKLQHAHILPLRNVVRAPDALDEFVQRLLLEMGRGDASARHDPAPISWSHHIARIEAFLRSFRGSG